MKKLIIVTCTLFSLSCSEKFASKPEPASPLLRATANGKNNFVYVVDGKEMNYREIHPRLDHYIVKSTLVTNDDNLRAKYPGRANVGVMVITTNRKL